MAKLNKETNKVSTDVEVDVVTNNVVEPVEEVKDNKPKLEEDDCECGEDCYDPTHDHSNDMSDITSIDPEVSIQSLFNNILTMPSKNIIELQPDVTIAKFNRSVTSVCYFTTELASKFKEYALALNPDNSNALPDIIVFNDVSKLCLYNMVTGIAEIIKGYKILSLIDESQIETLADTIKYVDDYLVRDESDFNLLQLVSSDIILNIANCIIVSGSKLSNLTRLTKDLTTIMTINNLCNSISNYMNYLNTPCFQLHNVDDFNELYSVDDVDTEITEDLDNLMFNDININELMTEDKLISTAVLTLSPIQQDIVFQYIKIINERLEAGTFIDYDGIDETYNPPLKLAINGYTELFIQYIIELNEYRVIISRD